MKENKKYNAVDFARYHSGAMPPDEMHALEKAALEDPFLADALDGYIYSKDHEKELNEIRMHLNERKKQKNVFSVFLLSQNKWWKIAAMFIIIAGAGYFFFIKNSQKEHSLAVKQIQAKKENPATISPAKDDTTAIEGNIAFEKASSDKNKNNKTKLSTPTANPIQTSPVEKVALGETRIREEKSHSDKHLADENEKIIAMNNDKAIQSDITRKDSGEQSFLRSSDTNALAAVSPKGYFKDSVNTVAMNREEPSLQEVVVTAYGKKRTSKKIISGELQGKVSGVEINKTAPYPKEGKEKFDQYIKDNAVPVSDSSGERITANILLSFTLNKKGKPAHIKVLESSCEACEKEAIRLLKNGPDWVGKSGTMTTVRIEF